MEINCPVCASTDLNYQFAIEDAPVWTCARCGLLFLNPSAPSTAEPELATTPPPDIFDIQRANALTRMEYFLQYSGLKEGRILLIGGSPAFESVISQAGFELVSLTVEEVESGKLAALPGAVQGCILHCALEAFRNPLEVLSTLRSRLDSPGGLLVIATTLDSLAGRLFGSYWWEFRRRNRYYFSTDTLQSLLLQAGFGDPLALRDRTVASLEHIQRKLNVLPSAPRYQLLRFALLGIPRVFRRRAFSSLQSRTLLLARPVSRRSPPKLSVIVPVYNERATFRPMMDGLLAKDLPGVEIRVIVVESNSTDGTRDEVSRYRDHPRVDLIFEDRPQGKGYAVRRGFEVADGDIILIQDADLEYDIDDYDALLKPILAYQRHFVIGSRHWSDGNVWKIRRFAEGAFLSGVFNLGHVIFRALFNLLYGQRLRDPFSMYKVFRRECLYGLHFESCRFDFDFELAIKLLRKGYMPLELPVNYRSRSFREGKKIRVLRDPLTWLRALVKYRTAPLYVAAPTRHPAAEHSDVMSRKTYGG